MLRAILIDCIPPSTPKDQAEYRLSEAESLVKTYGGIVVVKQWQKKLIPSYKNFLGEGKIDEIIGGNNELKANIVIVNNELKPRQIYNLGELFRPHKLEIWDRIDLILKIFQKHASTREAKLEIELASIKHMGPRIFGMGMQLSRQGGGIGTRGSGETNIEAMHRHLFKMEIGIKKELEDCKKVRKLHREGRRRKNLPTVGIIGYTNAGKTSLLNALTHKGAYAADKLFATLDTRIGKIYYPESRKEVLVSDTIGFIQDLPTNLIESFKSTLEETVEADLLLHVIDISDPKMEEKIKTVNLILAQIDGLYKPTMYVFTKTDRLPKNSKKLYTELQKKYAKFQPSFVSAMDKERIQELRTKIGENFMLILEQHPASHKFHP